jgi:hypothetical protein
MPHDPAHQDDADRSQEADQDAADTAPMAFEKATDVLADAADATGDIGETISVVAGHLTSGGA